MGAWLLHWLGMDNLSGPIYGFFSGSGSDIQELGIVPALALLYRRHNCHQHRCPRIGHLPVAGTPWVVCRKHHPKGAPTAQQIADAHAAAQKETTA